MFYAKFLRCRRRPVRGSNLTLLHFEAVSHSVPQNVLHSLCNLSQPQMLQFSRPSFPSAGKMEEISQQLKGLPGSVLCEGTMTLAGSVILSQPWLPFWLQTKYENPGPRSLCHNIAI